MILHCAPSSHNYQVPVFCDIAWMMQTVIFGSDSKMGSKSSLDPTDNSADSLARLRLISDAARLNEKQRRTARHWHFTKTQSFWERPKRNSSSFTFPVNLWLVVWIIFFYFLWHYQIKWGTLITEHTNYWNSLLQMDKIKSIPVVSWRPYLLW